MAALARLREAGDRRAVKGLGRYIGFGIGAAVFGSTGIILMTVGALRWLQTHNDDHLSGNWNWVPYVGALIVFGILILVFISRIKAKGKRT